MLLRDTDDPKVRNCVTLIALPNRAADLSDRFEPRFTKLRTLAAEPKRPKERQDTLLPRFINCTTEVRYADPSFVMPCTDLWSNRFSIMIAVQ